MRPPAETRLPFSLAAVILILAFAVITFYRLGARPLQDFDEAIYAQVAHEAMQSGHHLGFTWLGNPPLHRPILWFEKPPAIIWLTELSYVAFGVNEFAARFWPALFALLTLPLTFLFAQKLSKSYGAALLAVASFFGASQFCDGAQILQMDIPVGFFVLLALYAFWCARDNRRFYYLFWAALACGLMVKSVIGLLPLPIIFLFSILARDFDYLKIKHFWLGVLVFLALILPWHIIESIRYGREFWHQYLFYHLLERYSSALEGNSGPFTFYLDYLLEGGIFFGCLVAALVYFIVKSFKSKAHLFIATAVLFIFLFFSTAGTKLPPYILVIYPYAAIAIGMMLADLMDWLGKSVKNSDIFLIALIIVYFLVFGFGNAQVNMALTNVGNETHSQLVSDKAMGEYLKDHCLDEPVYFYSLEQIKPSIIFYSDRTVGYFADYQKSPPPKPFYLIAQKPPIEFPGATPLFFAGTEEIYQIH